MREKDIPEAMRLIEKRDKINEILRKMEESTEWALCYYDGEVPNSIKCDAFSFGRHDSHPLFHQMREMGKKYFFEQYKIVKDRLTELGLQ